MSRHARPVMRALVACAALVAFAFTPLRADDTDMPAAQSTIKDGLDVATYLEWETVGDPQLSPDGEQVIYTRRWVNKVKDDWDSAVWIMDVDGSRNRFLVKGADARWSPDGTSIAYLAEGDPEGKQVFVRWMDRSGGTSQITHVTEAPSNLRWSPDGQSIAFTMRVPLKDTWKIDMPKPPEGAEWTKAPRHVRTVHYRADRSGFLQDGFNHIFMVPASGGSPRQLTEGEWNVGARTAGIPEDVGIEWMPDGRHIVFDGLRDPGADRRYRESHLYAVDVETRDVRQITQRRGPWVNPVPSPDGRRLALLGYEWTPQTYKADELWMIDFDGSDMQQISGAFDRDPMQLHWTPDNKGLYFNADDRGSRNLWYANLTGSVRQVTDGEQMLTLSSTSARGWAVGTRSTPSQPAD